MTHCSSLFSVVVRIYLSLQHSSAHSQGAQEVLAFFWHVILAIMQVVTLEEIFFLETTLGVIRA